MHSTLYQAHKSPSDVLREQDGKVETDQGKKNSRHVKFKNTNIRLISVDLFIMETMIAKKAQK